MDRRQAGPADPAGPVLCGILALPSAEDALRSAYAEAQHRDVAVSVLIVGAAVAEQDALRDMAERWAEKYPAVPVSVTVRSGLDPAIALTAAARRCGLLVAAEPEGNREAAVLRAVAGRVCCPLAIVPSPAGGRAATVAA